MAWQETRKQGKEAGQSEAATSSSKSRQKVQKPKQRHDLGDQEKKKKKKRSRKARDKTRKSELYTEKVARNKVEPRKREGRGDQRRVRAKKKVGDGEMWVWFRQHVSLESAIRARAGAKGQRLARTSLPGPAVEDPVLARMGERKVQWGMQRKAQWKVRGEGRQSAGRCCCRLLLQITGERHRE